ncbi:hypothetical protein [Aeromicrobium endophyticum]|uniref:Uncharacterized protein n=1 Tax=Aeromicrobium endophyticum TaxID=2292704 RepID=A0A371P2T2_9ACTN|nr:hypothetical protein [Aeromicrobium endophyticum]REK69656.1 hypothetical protein DX116_10645 [Aeromicrobium endophyticum]
MALRDRATTAPLRRLLGRRTTWAAAAAAVALPFFVHGRGIELVPFALALVAGWLVAMSFVDVTSRARSPWRGAVLHAVVTAAGTAALVWSIGPGADGLRGLSEPLRGAVLLPQVAGLTGVCWGWLGLLARGLAALPSAGSRPSRASED